jgi:predicted PurR-regulated permease PerM
MDEFPKDKLSLEASDRAALQRPARLALWLVNVGLLLALFVFLRPAIIWCLNIASPFFVALIVAYIFNPVVGAFERRFRLSRTTGVLLTFGIILCLVAALFFLLLPVLWRQLVAGLSNVLDRIPIFIAAISEQKLRLDPSDVERIRAALEGKVSLDNLANNLTPMLRAVVLHVAQFLTEATRTIGAVVAYSFGFVGFLILVLMITFYCLIDFHRIGRFFAVVVPATYRPRFLQTWEKIDIALGGFLRGQLIVSFIIGTLYSIALLALGLREYSLLIGFAAGFGNLIPYVGPIVGAVPTILWILFGASYPTVGAKVFGILCVLAISAAIQAFDGFVLQPRIVGKSAGLHPLMVIAALLVGAQFGLGGLILAVPTAVVLRVLVKEFWWSPLAARRAKDGNAAPTNQAPPES